MSASSVEQESLPTSEAGDEEETLVPKLPSEKWKCVPCGRWRYNSWWAIYQHFRKVHPHIEKADILKNCERIN